MTRLLPGRQSDDGERPSQMGGHAALRAKTTSAGDIEPLISFEEAAHILGMGERSLRTIIQRSRERIAGRWTSGPTICFYQPSPKAAIKFRREWLEEFISQHTYDPRPSPLQPAETARRQAKEDETTGFGFHAGSAGPDLGFDPQLYDL